MEYQQSFASMTGVDPFPYQSALAEELFAGRNVVLRAPTGAGKTWSVLVPFLCDGWQHRPSKLLYVLPLRTLAESIYHQAQELFQKAGRDHSEVTMQTGEQPDDPFLDTGKVIVTTYDQLLSGLLDGPYGLSNRLHNINAAAIAGALVVFDEFHLMEPHRAFLTSAAMLHVFGELCQSVWMTATATSPLVDVLSGALNTVVMPAGESDWQQMLGCLPSVTQVNRSLKVHDAALSAEAVLDAHSLTSVVLMNTVGRAQSMFEGLRAECRKRGADPELLLLHARFFKSDRRN
ncbi:MAG: DEAD/DEAH box helicase, partial [Chloroflexota bacterium]